MSLQKISVAFHSDQRCSIVYRREDGSEYHVGMRFFGSDSDRDEFIAGLSALLQIYDVALGHGKYAGRQLLLFPNKPMPYDSQRITDEEIHGVSFK